MFFKSPVKLKRALAFRAVELAMRVDRVLERVVDQSVDVTSAGRFRSFERVQQRTAEQAVSLAPRERVSQETAERQVELPLMPEATVEVARFTRVNECNNNRRAYCGWV